MLLSSRKRFRVLVHLVILFYYLFGHYSPAGFIIMLLVYSSVNLLNSCNDFSAVFLSRVHPLC